MRRTRVDIKIYTILGYENVIQTQWFREYINEMKLSVLLRYAKDRNKLQNIMHKSITIDRRQ